MNGVNCIDRTLYPLTHPEKRIWYIEKITIIIKTIKMFTSWPELKHQRYLDCTR